MGRPGRSNRWEHNWSGPTSPNPEAAIRGASVTATVSVYGKKMNGRALLSCWDTLFREIALINDEEQYSLWPTSNEIPAG